MQQWEDLSQNYLFLLPTSDPPRLRSSDKHIIGTNMFGLL